jgi:hypothetical protein
LPHIIFNPYLIFLLPVLYLTDFFIFFYKTSGFTQWGILWGARLKMGKKKKLSAENFAAKKRITSRLHLIADLFN